MPRVNLTERRIAALEPDPAGKQRRELRDALVPSLIVRCGAGGSKVYALHTRFPGAKHPTRRAIGEVGGAMTLDDARTTAKEWLAMIRKGIDPQVEVRRREDEIRRARDQERLQQEGLFARVADDYLTRKVAGQRRARSVERIVNNVLVPAWGDKPITEITRRDLVKLVEQINDRPAPAHGRRPAARVARYEMRCAKSHPYLQAIRAHRDARRIRAAVSRNRRAAYRPALLP